MKRSFASLNLGEDECAPDDVQMLNVPMNDENKNSSSPSQPVSETTQSGPGSPFDGLALESGSEEEDCFMRDADVEEPSGSSPPAQAVQPQMEGDGDAAAGPPPGKSAPVQSAPGQSRSDDEDPMSDSESSPRGSESDSLDDTRASSGDDGSSASTSSSSGSEYASRAHHYCPCCQCQGRCAYCGRAIRHLILAPRRGHCSNDQEQNDLS